MKSVLDDLRPEPRQKMWQKFENEGIVHKEYVPPRHTVNGKFYCDVLRRMRENTRRKHPDKLRNNSWALHHDNTPAHAVLASTNTTVFPHPPTHRTWPPVISPVLEDETDTQGRRFDSTEVIQTESQNVTKTLTRNDFQKCFRSRKSRWNRCINAKGDYFEGDGGE